MSKEIVQLVYRKEDPLVIGDDVFPPANDYTLNQSNLNIAYKELNETENKKKSCLQELKTNLLGEKIKYRTDDEYLLRYLRFRKYDCDKTFKTIQKFYSKRERYSDLFSLPSNLESLLDRGFISWMPHKDQDGCILFHVDCSKWDPNEVSLRDLMPPILAICDIVTMNPHSQINGVKGIWNAEGVRAAHLPDLVRNLWFSSYLLQDFYPWRIRKIIAINCSDVPLWFFDKLRFALKKKIHDRFKVLGSDYQSELHKLVKPAFLPKKYGGEVEGYIQFSKQTILDNLPYLKYERSFISKKNI